MYFVKAFTNQ